MMLVMVMIVNGHPVVWGLRDDGDVCDDDDGGGDDDGNVGDDDDRDDDGGSEQPHCSVWG